MKKITLAGSVSIEKFERGLEANTNNMSLSYMTTANSFISHLDKNKQRFKLTKAGSAGISGGQMFFYAKYYQEDDETVVKGNFDLPAIQKAILYILFIVIFAVFAFTTMNLDVYILIAAAVYNVVLYFLYQVLILFSTRLLKKRYTDILALLKRLLNE